MNIDIDNLPISKAALARELGVSGETSDT